MKGAKGSQKNTKRGSLDMCFFFACEREWRWVGNKQVAKNVKEGAGVETRFCQEFVDA